MLLLPIPFQIKQIDIQNLVILDKNPAANHFFDQDFITPCKTKFIEILKSSNRFEDRLKNSDSIENYDVEIRKGIDTFRFCSLSLSEVLIEEKVFFLIILLDNYQQSRHFATAITDSRVDQARCRLAGKGVVDQEPAGLS